MKEQLSKDEKDDLARGSKMDSCFEELNKNIKEISRRIGCIEEKVNKLEERSENTECASRESLGDMINQKYTRYIKGGGIPEDELDQFIDLHAAYKRVGGNHSGDAKFNYCINSLPILPPNANLTYDEKKE